MSKFLKGNYKIEETKKSIEKKEETAEKVNELVKEFEKKSLTKLGGSIAFVVKQDGFLWTGDDENE